MPRDLHDVVLSAAGSIASSSERSPATTVDIRFAGALTFSEGGVLFVGDNHNGVIHAFEIPGPEPDSQTRPFSIRNIDQKIAELLGVRSGAIEINDLAAHPVTNEVYISVTRIESFAAEPAIVRLSADHDLTLLDLSSLPYQRQELTAFPPADATLQVRGSAGTTLPRDAAKGAVAIRSLAIMDLEYHDGALLVAGVGYDDFRSTLRRIPYPFDGTQQVAAVEMYHVAHDQYESRAPIRAMSVQEVDGEPQLVAAYTCSPVVLVPLTELEDGARISARTIIDMGNGQPLDMVPFRLEERPMLFVTSNSRSPQVIPVDGLSGVDAVTSDSIERGAKLDLHPLMPFGPAGKAVMFEGVPLHTALLDDDFFVSIKRDASTGDLNLDADATSFPNRVHNLVAEMDFPSA